MGKNNKTNYLDYFKEQIDWESVLTLMRIIVMTKSWGDPEYIAIESCGKKYNIKKDKEMIQIKCSDGRIMSIGFKLGEHRGYDGTYYAAGVSVVIKINDHSKVVFKDIIKRIEEECEVLYLGKKEIDTLKPIYTIPIEGFGQQYDVINDEIVHDVNDKSWSKKAQNDENGKRIGYYLLSTDGEFIPKDIDEKDWPSKFPTLVPTLIEIDKFRNFLAYGNTEPFLFGCDELRLLVEVFYKKYAKRIKKYEDDVLGSIFDGIAERRESALNMAIENVSKAIENAQKSLLPEDYRALMEHLEAVAKSSGAKK